MKFPKLNSDKIVSINISKYLCDWSRKVSGPQFLVKKFLFPFWKNAVVLEEFVIPGSRFRIDLVSLTSKIAIEISPDKVHLQYNKFFHQSRAGFLKKLTSDFKKRSYCEDKCGWKFIELYDEDLNNLSPEYLKEKFNLDL